MLKAIGEVCRAQRVNRKFSLALASIDSGISISTIQRIEMGRGGHATQYASYVRWLGGSLRAKFR